MSHPSTSKTKPLCMMVSVQAEGNIIADRLMPSAKRHTGIPDVRTGTINTLPVVYCVAGIGKTNAAHCLTSLILNFSPSALMLFGVGGAYPASGLRIGDIAVATKEVYADEGVLLKDGFHSLDLIGIPLLKAGGKTYFNEFPLDAVLAKKMLRASGSAGLRAADGVFATVSTCTGTRKRADDISRRFGAICENMEGASVAHVCRLYSLPCVEVRGISNIVEKRDRSKWDIAKASENCQRTVLEFLKDFNSQ